MRNTITINRHTRFSFAWGVGVPPSAPQRELIGWRGMMYAMNDAATSMGRQAFHISVWCGGKRVVLPHGRPLPWRIADAFEAGAKTFDLEVED